MSKSQLAGLSLLGQETYGLDENENSPALGKKPSALVSSETLLPVMR